MENNTEVIEEPIYSAELRKLTVEARKELPVIARQYAEKMGVKYSRITIRHQRSRWGSCSSKGSINLNCVLMLVPYEIREYVVVHELCHLIEMNHSKAFWNQVENILPDYRDRRNWLRDNGNKYISRLREKY